MMIVIALGTAISLIMLLRQMYELRVGRLLVGLAVALVFILACELFSEECYGAAIIIGSAVCWAIMMMIIPDADRGKQIIEANEDIEKAMQVLDGMVITRIAGDEVSVRDPKTGPMSSHYHSEVVYEAKALLWQAKLERLRLQLVPW